MKLRVALVCVSLVLASCAQMRTIASSPSDYAAFRQTRLAPTLEARLVASVKYLQDHPQGTFVRRVEAFLERADPVYFASKRDSAAGLRTYLRVLPEGKHADEAKRRLAGIDSDREQQAEMSRRALATEARLERVAAQRAHARDEMGRWIDRFADPRAFAGVLSQGPAELVVAWSLGLPAPACTFVDGAGSQAVRRCTKIVELPYTVPVRGVAEERQITLEITVDQDPDGRPLRAALAGPELFTRLHEATAVRPVPADDAAARGEAIAAAAALAQKSLARHGALSPDCRRDVEAPIVLDLRCNGMKVVVRAGATAADDDVIEITPGG